MPTKHKSANRKTKQSTKTEALIALLPRSGGATVAELMKASGWRAHSVRGFISGTAKKKLGLIVTVETDETGARCYRATTRQATGEAA